MTSTEMRRRLPPIVHLIVLVTLSLLVWGYWPGWVSAWETWQSDPDYNHGFLVLPIAGWLLWQRRKDLEHVEIAGSWWGLVFIALSVVLRVAGVEFFLSGFDTWSIPIWIAGVVLLFGGWQLLRWAAGAIAFLWFMTPIPGTITVLLSMPLQKISALLSTWSLLTFAQPAIRQGTTIMLGEHILEVERACSGLRICYGIAALAVGYVLLNRPGWIRSIVLIAAAIPIAIVANSFRVTLTGLLFLVVPGETAQKWSHDFAGIVMLPLAFGMLWLLARIMDRFIRAFEESGLVGSRMALKYISVLAVVGVILVYWHGRQSENAVQTLLKIADRYESQAAAFEEEGNLKDAVRQYGRAIFTLEQYYSLQPESHDITRRTALLSEKLAFSSAGAARSARLYRTAWTLFPDDQELGLKCAELAVRGNLNSLAVESARTLLEKLPEAGDEYRMAFGIQLRAMIAEALGANPKYNWSDVVEVLKSGLEKQVDPIGCAFQLALAYQLYAIEGLNDSDRDIRSAEVFRELLQKQPDDPLSHYAFFGFLKMYPRVGAIKSDSTTADGQATAFLETTADAQLNEAIRLAEPGSLKDHFPIWLAAAIRALSEQNFADATRFYQRVIAVRPAHAVSQIQLSRLVSGLSAQAELGLLTPEQHQLAISSLRNALLVDDLDNALAVKLELLSHLLELRDEASAAEAQKLALEVRNESATLPDEAAAALMLELAMIESRALAENGDLEAAVAKLTAALEEKNISKIPKGPGILSNAWVALGNWYQQLDQKQQAEVYYRKAQEAEPRSLPSLYQEYVGAERMNRPEAASEYLDQMLDLMGDRPDLWLSKARSELELQLGRPVKDRDFSAFNTAIQRAEQQKANPADVAVLKADIMLTQSDDQAALEFLEDTASKGQESVSLWRAIAILRIRVGRSEQADEALRRYTTLSPSPFNGVILAAELKMLQGDLEGGRDILEKSLTEDLDEQQRKAAELMLIELTASIDPMEAEKRLNASLTVNPGNIRDLVRLGDLKWARGDLVGLEAVEESLKQAEGDQGVDWRELRARRLLELARQSKSPEERKTLQDEAAGIIRQLESRGDYARKDLLRILEGRLALLDGRIQDAAALFQDAWKNGVRTAPLAVELLQTLLASGNIAQLKIHLGQMNNLLMASPALFDIALVVDPPTILSEISIFSRTVKAWDGVLKNSESALRVARVIRLQLPGVTDSEALQKEAEAAYQSAIERSPENPQAWGEYLQYLVSEQRQSGRWLPELQKLHRSDVLPKLDKEFVTAQILELAQVRELGLHYWRNAVRTAQGHADRTVETRVLTRAALAHAASDSPAAIAFMRRAVELQPEVKEHLRVLSFLLLKEGSEPSLQEALTILPQWLSEDPAGLASLTDEGRRIAAEILYSNAVTDKGDARPEGRELLVRADNLLRGIRQQTDEDIVLTSMVTVAMGDEESAMRTAGQRLSLPDASPTAIRRFVDYSRKRFGIAADKNRTLERILRDLGRRPGTELLALDLRLSEPEITEDRCYEIGNEYLETVVSSRSEAQGQRELLQAAFIRLLSRGHFDTWLKLVQSNHQLIAAGVKLEAATQSLIFTRKDEANEPAYRTYLQAELQKVNSQLLERNAADYFFSRMLWNEAETLYRKCIQRNAKDVTAMNNLALVVVENRQDFAEGHKLLETAFAIQAAAGPDADTTFLKDTQSQLWLAEGAAEKSLPQLESLATDVLADAGACLHYAECLRQLGRTDESKLQFERALDIGISPDVLQPIDRRFYDALLQVHGPLTDSLGQR